MEGKNKYRFVATIILAGLLLAACTAGGKQAALESEGEPAPQQQADVGAPDGEIEESEGAATPIPPESAAAEVKPTPRGELNATDASTVSLASGRLQLIEFFAFW